MVNDAVGTDAVGTDAVGTDTRTGPVLIACAALAASREVATTTALSTVTRADLWSRSFEHVQLL
jgi:hypothetical protein